MVCFSNVEALNELEKGEVIGTKEAEIIVSDEKSGREAEVSIVIEAKEFSETIYEEVDIALVIDYSSSMVNNNTTITIEKVNNACPNGTEEIDNKCLKTVTRLESAKIAAKELAKTFLTSNGNFKISLSIFDADGEVSNVLTDDLGIITDAIDEIEENGRGTNIQDGINKGASTLTNNNDKVMILLSDGEPYDYTYTWKEDVKEISKKKNTIYHYDLDNDGTSEYSFKDSVEAAKQAADYYRDETYFYTIGYNASNTANDLLKYVAGSNDRFITASNGDTLLQAFLETAKNIKEQYTIANNAILEDIIPNTFELIDKESLIEKYGNDKLKIEENDSNTKLIYNIKDISNKDIELNFKIKAKDDYHGAMFTNDEAILTFTPVNNNPYNFDSNNDYIKNANGSYSLVLNKPTVIIPAITEDDYVGVVEVTDELNIKKEALLVNDNNSNFENGRKVDKVFSVTDSIIIVDAPKRGILTTNTTGFGYKPNGIDGGTDNFTYKIKTTIKDLNNIEKSIYSNISTAGITIIPKKTSFVVHHYLENSSTPIAKDDIPKDNDTYFIGDIITLHAHTNLENYELVGKEINKTIKLEKGSNEVVFYYKLRDSGKVIVHYYENGTNNSIDDQKDVEKIGKVTENYLTEIKEFDNWELVEIPNNYKGIFTLNNQEVTYFYKKIMGKVIIKFVDTSGNKLIDDIILTEQIGTPYKIEEKEFKNYSLVKKEGNNKGIYTKEDSNITYIYEPIKIDSNIVNTGINNNFIIKFISIFTFSLTGLIIFKRKYN